MATERRLDAWHCYVHVAAGGGGGVPAATTSAGGMAPPATSSSSQQQHVESAAPFNTVHLIARMCTCQPGWLAQQPQLVAALLARWRR
jgi:hypothetical protein